MKKIKAFLCSALLAIALPAAQAQSTWRPNEPVRAILPFAPGGGADAAMRHFQKWAEDRGVKILPVYKGGAEGLIGMEDVARGPADGLTISFGTAATAAVHKTHHPDYNFNYISAVRVSIMTFVTHPGSNINNLEDLEREIRNPNTRKTFGVGAPGQKLTMEQLFKHTGTKKDPTLIGYKGGGPVLQDILGGHIDVAVLPMAILKPHIDAGKVRVLGITVREPWPEVAVYPIVNKKYPTWENNDGFLLSLPAGVKPEVLAFWTDFVRQYMSDKSVQADFRRELTEITTFGSKAATDYIASVIKNYKKENK